MTHTPHRTRIKICGLTREADVHACCQAGVDAVGLVLYSPSPRAVSPQRAGELAQLLPPFVTPVLLFVNATAAEVAAGLAAVPNALLQFHGDETPEQCYQLALGRPFMRAARVPTPPAGAQGFDLLKYAQDYSQAQAILLDALVQGYGGGGHAFDWTAFHWSHPQLNASSRLVLSGGLTPANVADGIRQVRPWAVDVSSGVEAAKGIKDPALIHQFVSAVRSA
jgi:phosphoribosylanthranilate isomerase